MILIKFYNGNTCEHGTVECENVEDAEKQMKALTNDDIYSDFYVYECERLNWEVKMTKVKER